MDLKMEEPFELKLRVAPGMAIIQIIFALPFTVGAFWILLSIFNGTTVSVLRLFVFLLCTSLAYMGWANALSTIQVTEKSVTVTVFYGRFRIDWHEVDKILSNTPYIALMGGSKRVVLSLQFARSESDTLLEFFNHQVELRKIEFEENGTPFPLTQKNARVWW